MRAEIVLLDNVGDGGIVDGVGDDLGTGQVIQRDSIFVSEAGRWVIDVLANGCFDDEVAGDRLRLRDRSGSSQKDVGLRVGAVSHG